MTYANHALKLVETPKKEVTAEITQGSEYRRLGRSYTPFVVDLKTEDEFTRFIRNLPEGSRGYHLAQKEDSDFAVTVVMPGDYAESFDLSDVTSTLDEMYAHSLHNKNYTQVMILDALVKAVR